MEGPSGEKLQMAQAKVRIAEMVLQERQQVNSPPKPAHAVLARWKRRTGPIRRVCDHTGL